VRQRIQNPVLKMLSEFKHKDEWSKEVKSRPEWESQQHGSENKYGNSKKKMLKMKNSINQTEKHSEKHEQQTRWSKTIMRIRDWRQSWENTTFRKQ
jgi:hypothetical protein